jgi:hypothetical protein
VAAFWPNFLSLADLMGRRRAFSSMKRNCRLSTSCCRFWAEVLGDRGAAGEYDDILPHGLAAIAEERRRGRGIKVEDDKRLECG